VVVRKFGNLRGILSAGFSFFCRFRYRPLLEFFGYVFLVLASREVQNLRDPGSKAGMTRFGENG